MQSDGEVTGRCYCGSVAFGIGAGTVPVLAGYCHCRDCRQAHAAPLYQYAYIARDAFSIDRGEHLLKWYTRSETESPRFRRYFCSQCGSKVYNTLLYTRDGQELRGVFPTLFDDQSIATNETWSPRKHVWCAQSLMDLARFQDDLPRDSN